MPYVTAPEDIVPGIPLLVTWGALLGPLFCASERIRSVTSGTLVDAAEARRLGVDGVHQGSARATRSTGAAATEHTERRASVGRKAGTVPGFPYSEAMRSSGWVWNEKTLDEFLTAPYLTLPAGNVAVDIRRSSPTFGRWVGERLSEANRRMMWVPEGFAHGFLVLSESAEFLYKHKWRIFGVMMIAW